MNKEEIIRKLFSLYGSSQKTTLDRENFEQICQHIHNMHDGVKILETLDNYENFLVEVLNALPVSELAKLCGTSRMQIYRLLKTNSRLSIYKAYKYK